MYIITQNSDSFLTKNSEVTVYVQLLHTYGDTYVLLQKKKKKKQLHVCRTCIQNTCTVHSDYLR